MRISTQMLYQSSNNDLTSMQSQILKLTQQVTAQQKVLLPSDDPVAAARALRNPVARRPAPCLRLRPPATRR